eukprot:CAMPEP_0205884216 /NCGR_PEP_ID=MMETSP1083-20121108/17988_1 /ASSEMBLY_ACC=CAM_ASM_000430 /TAXON_ID=97485 /ORGANISM="Prymnesium parvum, Strain Texoma1" /LENGTH=102 /DNA_ID=CAMNT_0053247579 /DNA_START=271 /DNA_END=577 /DNA_ORIENTATION=-
MSQRCVGTHLGLELRHQLAWKEEHIRASVEDGWLTNCDRRVVAKHQRRDGDGVEPLAGVRHVLDWPVRQPFIHPSDGESPIALGASLQQIAQTFFALPLATS